MSKIRSGINSTHISYPGEAIVSIICPPNSGDHYEQAYLVIEAREDDKHQVYILDVKAPPYRKKEITYIVKTYDDSAAYNNTIKEDVLKHFGIEKAETCCVVLQCETPKNLIKELESQLEIDGGIDNRKPSIFNFFGISEDTDTCTCKQYIISRINHLKEVSNDPTKKFSYDKNQFSRGCRNIEIKNKSIGCIIQ